MPSGYSLAQHLVHNPYFCYRILNPCLDYLSRNVYDDLTIIAHFNETNGVYTVALDVNPVNADLLPLALEHLDDLVLGLIGVMEELSNEVLLPRVPMAQKG